MKVISQFYGLDRKTREQLAMAFDGTPYECGIDNGVVLVEHEDAHSARVREIVDKVLIPAMYSRVK